MVYAPASMGEVGIAPRHAPLLTTLKPGEVRIEDTEGKGTFFLRHRRNARDPAAPRHRGLPIRHCAEINSTKLLR